MGIEYRYEEWRKRNPLRVWRESQEPQISRATVCAATGSTTNTVVKWEQGSNIPSDDNMESLARLMGTSAQELKDHWIEWLHLGVRMSYDQA